MFQHEHTSAMPSRVPPPGDRPRVERDTPTMTDRGMTTDLTTEEWTVIAHLRTWCHQSTACPLCREQDHAARLQRTLDSIIEG